ncbi:MAG: pre-tRNA nuclear export protein [Sclerophora amabilis]|nr:MAG: pre-tRNA nuclear export protein [Sclerophora amabilis]
MDAQIENAVEIAWNPTSDQYLKGQAFDFLNGLRSDPSGWQVCLSLATRTSKPSEVVRHVALEIVNNTIQNQQLDEQKLGFVKDNLLEYLVRVYGGLTPEHEIDPPNLQNKFTQTITLLFIALYAHGWGGFFDDFLGLTRPENGISGGHLAGVVLYLRVLSSIHDEIADVLVNRTPEELKRNNQLKDLIRVRDVQKLATSWQEILSYWRERSDLVLEMCLKVLGRWVSWIDISLIVNEALLNPLFILVGRSGSGTEEGNEDNVRNAAIDTFTEIVGKKMKPAAKLEMIVFLNMASIIAQLSESPPLRSLRNSPNYDTDLADAVAKLVNMTALDIIKILETESIDDNTRNLANEQLQGFFPHILRFFTDEYDEICSDIIPSLTDLLALFRKDAKAKGALAPLYSSMLSPILDAIITKMKYDETSSWSHEDEQTDEAEFQELRKRLQVLQQSVAAVDDSLYTQTISDVVGNTFATLHQRGGQIDWRDLDLALHEMFLFGEMAVKNGGLYNKHRPTSQSAERLAEMMTKMVESGTASFSHPAIQLQYMEICVRYCAFFEVHSRFIPQVLESFIQFVHHDHVRVKLRSWYLFQRFVKHLRSQLGNISQDVIEAINDLLAIKAELPKEDTGGDDNSSEDNDQTVDALFNSQLYLFEAVGCISSTTAVPVEKQVLFANSVSEPLFSDIEKHLGMAKTGDERAVVQIHHDMMALGTLARGFSDWNPGGSTDISAPAQQVSAVFVRVEEAIQVALESLKSSFLIRSAARFAFSRLIGVLGSHILPQLPRWIDGLLSQSSTKDEMATFLRLLQQVVYSFKTEISNILDSLLAPLLQRVFAGLAEPTTGTDDEVQLADLRREYLNFLLVILNNDLGSVLISTAQPANQHIFDTLITTIEHFAKDIKDYPTSRIAFSLFSKMSSQWGGPDIINPLDPSQPPLSKSTSNGTNEAPSVPQTNIALLGFDRFMIERFSAVSWELPTNAAFNVKDAQARQVLGEVAGLQKAIYAKTGKEFLTWLREVWFPGLRMGQDMAEEYLRALEVLDAKEWRQFFLVSGSRSWRITNHDDGAEPKCRLSYKGFEDDESLLFLPLSFNCTFLSHCVEATLPTTTTAAAAAAAAKVIQRSSPSAPITSHPLTLILLSISPFPILPHQPQ